MELLTPERAQMAAEGGALPLPPSPSPLRRSPRFSSPLPPAALVFTGETMVSDDEQLESRPMTPENEQLADEPSSVLASRIMRSQSNPSPPPASYDEGASAEQPFSFLRDDSSPLRPIASPQPVLATFVLENDRLDGQSKQETSNAQGNEDINQSVSLEFAFPPAMMLEALPEPPEATAPTLESSTLVRDEVNTTDEEADVAEALIPSDTDSPAPSSSRLSTSDGNPQTPVRRSNRPRKSVFASPDLTPGPGKDKGKGKPDPSFDATPRPNFGSRREVSPLRAQLKESSRSVRKQLMSLSPGAVGILGTLLPSPLPDVNQTEYPFPDTSRFPVSTPCVLGNLPYRPPLGTATPSRTGSSSPTRLFTRTESPARRVPLDETIVSGRRSPSKLHSGQVLIHRTASDSPARRVPLPVSAVSGNLEPFVKQAILTRPMSSPTRSRSVDPPSVTRPTLVSRGGSAEPSNKPLPFPLAPRLPPTISEEPDSGASSALRFVPSKSNDITAKSSLRQPTTSKIPRPKPYTRPTPSVNVNKSRLPTRQVLQPAFPGPASGTTPKTSEVAGSSLKRKHSTLDQSTSPSKMRLLRPVPSSPTKALPRKRYPDEESTITSVDDIGSASATPSSIDNISGVRRTTRARRPTSSDVFPPSSLLPAGPPRQRKPPAVRTEVHLFRGITPAAWTSMTRTNTAKNEEYQAAKLEVEIVRKEGIRPDSPIMKVKTRTQKEQDERGAQRSKRAERRAQRLSGTTTPTEDMEENDGDDDSGDAGSPPRHRRGPGDEEDYVTPDRTKKSRFHEDEEDDSKGAKNVKWDRGLWSTKYTDEIKLSDHKLHRELKTVKSCLAPTAKFLNLDKLGNLVTETSSPLRDLVPENVIVKKIVYDSDIEPTPPVEPAKNTRSRGKKKL